jgi:hypothetical protein
MYTCSPRAELLVIFRGIVAGTAAWAGVPAPVARREPVRAAARDSPTVLMLRLRVRNMLCLRSTRGRSGKG